MVCSVLGLGRSGQWRLPILPQGLLCGFVVVDGKVVGADVRLLLVLKTAGFPSGLERLGEGLGLSGIGFVGSRY